MHRYGDPKIALSRSCISTFMRAYRKPCHPSGNLGTDDGHGCGIPASTATQGIDPDFSRGGSGSRPPREQRAVASDLPVSVIMRVFPSQGGKGRSPSLGLPGWAWGTWLAGFSMGMVSTTTVTHFLFTYSTSSARPNFILASLKCVVV